ncbi:D-amino acid oxidase [Purpureocillium lavendulum]|uniref:D-amino acid oxidase n=1 Tax=Purpureocillium lavendulum TaxID=1247861 RepID=A0AB34FDI4_9HYPO|nr:D-amino acid oxidase [Purpureocillium lavendulum]
MATAESFSSEKTAAFHPTKVLFLNTPRGVFSDKLHVLDLTSHVTASLGTDTSPIPKTFRDAVERAASGKELDPSVWAFELTRSTSSSVMQFHDVSADSFIVAEVDMPVLKHYSMWKETFVKDSMRYKWDMPGGDKGGVLYKHCVPIAKFDAMNLFKESCVLVLDERHLDTVVALSTCVVVLCRDI